MIVGKTNRRVSLPRKHMGGNDPRRYPQIDICPAGPSHLHFGLRADFITATVAMPHMDDGYTDEIFLTLSLRDGYEFGGDWMRDRPDRIEYDHLDFRASRGDFFIIDPARLHWGAPDGFGYQNLGRRRWWGLQWTIPINPDTETIMEGIVRAYGGVWEPNEQHFLRVMEKKRAQVNRDSGVVLQDAG